MRAVGLRLTTWSAMSPDTVTLTVYGESDALLGTTTSSSTVAGSFWGVSSTVSMRRINVYSPADRPEVVDDVRFLEMPIFRDGFE